MRPLRPREKRTVRMGALGLLLYLAIFYGQRGWAYLEEKRAEYDQLLLKADKLKLEFVRENNKRMRLGNLKSSLRIELQNLREETVVGEARGAIQKAAQACGVQLGSSKETPGRAAAKELASIQIDGSTTTLAFLQFLHGLRSLGYPLVIERLSLQTAGMQPGQVRFSLSTAVLNFAAWKAEEKSSG